VVDEFLFAIIFVGVALAIAYLKAEYELHIRSKGAERQKKLSPHDLHPSGVRFERNGIPVHVRIGREPTQLFRSIRFLARHSHSTREHRTN
jgi:hypothetical protein